MTNVHGKCAMLQGISIHDINATNHFRVIDYAQPPNVFGSSNGFVHTAEQRPAIGTILVVTRTDVRNMKLYWKLKPDPYVKEPMAFFQDIEFESDWNVVSKLIEYTHQTTQNEYD